MKRLLLTLCVVSVAALSPAPIPVRGEKFEPEMTQAQRASQQSLQGTTGPAGTYETLKTEGVPLPPNDPNAAAIVAGVNVNAAPEEAAAPAPAAGPNWVAILLCVAGVGILAYLMHTFLMSRSSPSASR